MQYTHTYRYFGNKRVITLLLCSALCLLCSDCKSNAQSSKTSDMEKIKVGSQLPHFALRDQNGKLFDIDSVKGKKNLVIYFYPKDDTPGCTKEACSFRDQFVVFEEVDAMIIGISSQSVESHQAFAQKYHLNFTLLSDSDRQVSKLFGVSSDLLGLLPGRVTYVVSKEGKVVYVFNSQTQATKHVEEALRILKTL
jgi:peroxiredoxin Q/BCP